MAAGNEYWTNSILPPIRDATTVMLLVFRVKYGVFIMMICSLNSIFVIIIAFFYAGMKLIVMDLHSFVFDLQALVSRNSAICS